MCLLYNGDRLFSLIFFKHIGTIVAGFPSKHKVNHFRNKKKCVSIKFFKRMTVVLVT